LLGGFVPGSQPWGFVEVKASTITATTAGPARPGYFDLQYFSDGSGDIVPAAIEGGSIFGVFQWSFHDAGHTLIPYTLGTPFGITVGVEGLATQDLNGLHGWSGIASFQLQIHEGTPTGPLVQITDVPEPRDLAAGGLMMLMTGVWLSIRRARSPVR